MNSTLSFEYEFSRDGDDFGWLIVRVDTPDFSGRNGMWVQWQDIADFAASLSSFPIQADKPITCEWGFGEHEQYTTVTSVNIVSAGTTGGLIADVFLANFDEPKNRCRTLFQIDYPSLIDFKDQIERMMHNKHGAAALQGMKANVR